MRDLWKQKFMNFNYNNNNDSQKRYSKKKPQSELRFPQITNLKS